MGAGLGERKRRICCHALTTIFICAGNEAFEWIAVNVRHTGRSQSGFKFPVGAGCR